MNNEDPIKENKVFRIGLDNLTEDDDINLEDYDEYNDLHECSNDLSDRGSRMEEIAHARYAESQRRNAYYNSTSTTSKVILNNNSKWVVYALIFLFIGLPIIEVIIGFAVTFFEAFSQFSDNNVSENSSYYSEEEEFYPIDVVADGEDVFVSGKMNYTQKLLTVDVENFSEELLQDCKIEVIFYDINNKPIEVTDLQIETLMPNEIKYKKIYNVPEGTAKYDFMINENYTLNKTMVYDN